MSEIPMTIPDLHAAYARGVTPGEVIRQVYARLAQVDDPGIFLSMPTEDAARAEAEALGPFDPARPLWGIPFAVKDNIDVAGHPTTAACPAFAYTLTEDAFVVARLRAAGAIFVGKTNLDQFATGLVGVRTPYGAPRNAIDPLIVPGGSSAGSAVAVGHGIVPLALGTDTAGSGRVPAALNNIVGLKPTLGALSATGVVPACRSIETISVFAMTVRDAYAAYRVCSAFDPADAFARDIPAPDLAAPAPAPVIGIPGAGSIRFFGDDVQAEAFAAAVDLLRGQGAVVREVDFTPLYAVADMLYDGAWVAERYTVIEDLLKTDPEAILPVTRQIIGKAESLSAADAFRGIYRLKELARAAAPLLADLDMLCVPTIPRFYSVADLEADPITPNSNLGTYTNFVNLLDMCALAVPTPARGDGRPGSVTLLARAGQDAALAALALTLEAAGDRRLGATGWPHDAGPPLPPAPADRLTLAVCGAHMTGLPLNHQLLDRGGKFVRPARTTDAYRFYALAGGPPARPGLVRGAPGSGAPVALELWSLPLAEVGSFLAGIPAPLGIGTLELEDGATVQGFLCEATATQGATDITHLANWRSYVTTVPA
ncbi:allophanate hydrolase [Roseisalinus antarcticus]|uniref:Allophanate hydrolase n=1 Tax=Roseisalinus antarcticus TaxID=254357 RepID=A0A1Y5RFX8_9RHOB|nr:allophanate hydrolase [Roseisalinus antarcticus]SLN15315.1 Allophanate hydrolase [Roseisalinus antarcticus]